MSASTRLVIVDILVDQRIRLVAPRPQGGLHVCVAELGECRFVDLHVAASGRGERSQFAAERRDDVVPEFIHVAISVCRHGRVAAAEMQRARAGDRDLRQRLGSGAQEGEVGRRGSGLSMRCGCAIERHRLRAAACPPRRTAPRTPCRRAGRRNRNDTRRGGIHRRSRDAGQRAPAAARPPRWRGLPPPSALRIDFAAREALSRAPAARQDAADSRHARRGKGGAMAVKSAARRLPNRDRAGAA